MVSSEQEQLDTIDRITNSPFLAGLKHGPRLLQYLFQNRDKRLKESTIAVEALDAKTDKQIFGGNARQQCKKLRDSLQEYAEAGHDDEWRFFLPEQTGVEGYQLKVVNLRASFGAVNAFWRAHLKPIRPVVIVWNEPLFYRDEAGTAVVRVPGFDGNSDGAERIQQGLIALSAGTMEGETYTCHQYAASGEIGARDRLADWFSKEVGIRTDGAVSRHMNSADDLAEWSPILLGSVLTNKILKEVTEWYQYRRFGYHIDARGCGVTAVRKATGKEQVFVDLDEKYDAEEIGDDLLLRDDPRRDQVVFATVTRLPNHHNGENAITILSASYTKVLEQLAYVLTDEQDLKRIFQQVEWSLENNVPRYFQWLFSVRLGNHHADNRPAKPKLRRALQFERFAEQD